MKTGGLKKLVLAFQCYQMKLVDCTDLDLEIGED